MPREKPQRSAQPVVEPGRTAAADRSAAGRLASTDLIIARLEAEIDKLRKMDRHLLVRPFLIDLHRLRDDLLRQAKACQAGEATMAAAEVSTLLESFAYTVEQMLVRGGVEIVRPEIGSPFDASRHRAAGTQPSTSGELDGTVAEVIREGYFDTTTDRALTTATVRVYRAIPPADR